ncbi:hypothetical protein [Hydrogenimonas sp. SS33]|uniref:hypothetical protein n=1 Tax=Hydrogenimonas leucolamina TaxID=2954236 RepID=UPI00336BF241
MSLLSETERQFESYGAKTRSALIGGAALAVLAAGWLFWLEPLTEEIEAAQSRAARLQSRIAAVNLRALNRELARVKKQNLELRETLQKADAARRFLQSRASRLDFIWFDQKRFLDMLDKVLRRSVTLGLRIDLFESRPAAEAISPLIEKRAHVHIEGAGDYGQILRLLRYIESFRALLKTDSVRIGLDEQGETHFRIDFDSYGAKP